MEKRTKILHPLCLATIIAVGFAIVYGFVAGFCIATWQERTRARRTWENLQITTDGTPVIVSSTRYPATRTYRLLNGRSISVKEEENEWLPGVSLGVKSTIEYNQLGWRGRVGRVGAMKFPPVFWYFIHDGERDGRGYFVGYDSKTRLRVGYIGLDGLQPEKPREERQFPVNGLNLAYSRGLVTTQQTNYGYYASVPASRETVRPIVFLQSEDRVYRVDLQKRAVHVELKLPGLLSLQGFRRPVDGSENESTSLRRPSKLVLAARTASEVVLHEPDTGDSRAYLIPAELRDVDFTFYELYDGRALLQFLRHSKTSWASTTNLTWITATGEVVRREENILTHQWGSGPREPSFLTAAAMPVPIIVAAMSAFAVPMEELSRGAADDYPAALAWSLAETWPALLVVALFAAGLTVVCDRWQKRYGQPRSYIWLVFVFLLGLPGLMGSLFHRR